MCIETACGGMEKAQADSPALATWLGQVTLLL